MMNLDELNKKIENDSLYKFCIRHKKAINIIQGFFIVGLLIAINMYVVKDYFIKQQIADHCGYTTSRYECICREDFVNEWKLFQGNQNPLKFNLSSENLTDV